MSHECDNPRCPVHGTSPEAVANRQIEREIKTNGELMDIVRVMAANANEETIRTAAMLGIPAPQAAINRTLEILRGNADDDEGVRGIIKGLTIILQRSEPMKIAAESMKEVREPFLVERVRKDYVESGRFVSDVIQSLKDRF